MSAPITGTTKAWLCNDIYGPDDIKREGSKCVDRLGYSDQDMSRHGWTLIGEADITLRLVSDDTMVGNKVAALREEIKAVRANAEAKATALESKVQQLLAITNEVKS